HAAPASGGASRSRDRRPPRRQLPARPDDGGADDRPRLRQVPRAQPRARGPRRAERRGRGDGARAAGRDVLGPRHPDHLTRRAAVTADSTSPTAVDGAPATLPAGVTFVAVQWVDVHGAAKAKLVPRG